MASASTLLFQLPETLGDLPGRMGHPRRGAHAAGPRRRGLVFFVTLVTMFAAGLWLEAGSFPST